MNHYECPICKEKVSRDLAQFLNHSEKHIIDSIRKAHPEWEQGDGVCQKCVDYFKKVLRGEPVRGDEGCGKKK